GALAREESLRRDFHDLVERNRHSASRLILVQQALTVGRWQRQRDSLDAALLQVRSAALRQRFARYVNEVDGALGLHRDAFDEGALAKRISETGGAPIVDSVLLRGLAHVLADNASLWATFRCLVEDSIRARPVAMASIDIERSQ